MELANRIRTIRNMKGMKQLDIAENIGVTQATYSSYERKASNCSFYTLQKIAKALDVSVAFLVDIDNPISLGDK